MEKEQTVSLWRSRSKGGWAGARGTCEGGKLKTGRSTGLLTREGDLEGRGRSLQSRSGSARIAGGNSEKNRLGGNLGKGELLPNEGRPPREGPASQGRGGGKETPSGRRQKTQTGPRTRGKKDCSKIRSRERRQKKTQKNKEIREEYRPGSALLHAQLTQGWGGGGHEKREKIVSS